MFAGIRRLKGLFAVAALGLAVSVITVDMAEARRAGGGLGSRGTRTFDAPAATRTAPQPAAPINRTMTPGTPQNNSATRPQNQATPAAPAQQRRGLFGGMAGGLMGGLLMGGLFGMLMGGGFGGMAGFFGMLLQVALIGLLVMLAMRFFASRRQQPAYAGSAGNNTSSRSNAGGNAPSGSRQGGSGLNIPKMGSMAGAAAAAAQQQPSETRGDDLGITSQDLDTFQRILGELQTAYANEDYAALRRLSTPEAMSYLAEELSDNATSGVRNDVRNVQLLQGDIAESWREGDLEYATVAMLYSAIDVMRDRNTGKLISGDENNETETTEIWTFVRKAGGEWQVSAIQSAG